MPGTRLEVLEGLVAQLVERFQRVEMENRRLRQELSELREQLQQVGEENQKQDGQIRRVLSHRREFRMRIDRALMNLTRLEELVDRQE